MKIEERWNRVIDLPTLLTDLGEDLEREGLAETPERARAAWVEFLRGYSLDPQEILGRTFEAEGSGLLLCRNIEFQSFCEHHLVPFFGTVDIGYTPSDCLAGLSKFSRLVDCFSQRLQIQERMTQQIADAIQEYLKPTGVLVVARAKHLCCHGRGVKRTKMQFITSAQYGEIDPSLYILLLKETSTNAGT